MEFKGTKGEWELIPNDHYYEVSTGFDNPHRMNVSIHLHDLENGHNNISISDEGKANAQLISKSKQMLYMLNDLLHDKGLNDVSKREIGLIIKEATEIK